MTQLNLMDVQQAASAALAAHEKFMGGQQITAEENAIADAVMKAGCYAVAAYEAHVPKSGGEYSTLLWAFLTALIDPLSKDLDALREDPAAGEVARASRNQA